jgi:hypothetical protein
MSVTALFEIYRLFCTKAKTDESLQGSKDGAPVPDHRVGAAAMGMLMYAAYVGGGAAMLPENVGGRGLSAAEAHEVLGPFTEPISLAILLILVGVMTGGLSFVVTYVRHDTKNITKMETRGQS